MTALRPALRGGLRSPLRPPLSNKWAGGGGGGAAPVNTGLPVISGDPGVGETLSVTNGTWSNSPTGFTYQWKRAGVDIGGATANNYTLVVADSGNAITCTVTASNAFGSTNATSLGVIVAIDLNLPSGSIKFPENNQETALPGSFGALYQPTANIPTGWLGSDGAIFAVIRVPIDRTHENRTYRFLGGSSSTSGRRFYLGYQGTDDNVASTRGKLHGYMAGGSGGKINVDSLIVDETDILIVFKRSGDDHSVDWYSLTDGTKNTGPIVTDATAIGMDSWGRAYFGIGVGNDPNTVPASGSLLFNGTISCFPDEIAAAGYIAANVSDANWQSIALGADIITTLGATNLQWYREFEDTSTSSLAALPAATSDLSDPCETVDVDNITSGSYIRRQTSADYLLIDYIPTGYVFGLTTAQTTRNVTFSGTAGGHTGNVEVRIVSETGNIHKDWTVVGAISAGTWSGSISVDKMTEWCWLQARLASDTAVVAEMRELFGVGWKFGLAGQSQITLWEDQDGLGSTVPDANVRRISVSMEFQEDFVSKKQVMYRVGAKPGSDGTVALVNQWVEYGDTTPVLVVGHGQSGTSALAWINDSDPNRDWSDTQEIVDYTGSDYTGMLWQWGTSDIAFGSNYGEVLDAVVNGTGPEASDHHILDGLTFDNTIQMILSPFGRDAGTASGPNTEDTELSMSVAVAQQDWFTTEGYAIGPQLPDVFLDGNGGPHQDNGVSKGDPLYGARMAMAAARAVGIDTATNPSIASVQFTDGTENVIRVVVTLPNSGSLTTDGQNADVRGFEVSDDTGTTWSNAGFTGAVSGDDVLLTKSAGSWAGGGATQVRYCQGAPNWYGTSITQSTTLAGMLYETYGLDSLGLGLPVSGDTVELTVSDPPAPLSDFDSDFDSDFS